MNTYALSLSRLAILVMATAQAGFAQAGPDSAIYTLYRTSVTDVTMRLHVATFDAADGQAYNRDNCAQAQQLFAAQAGVKVTFWCESGRFRAVSGGATGPSKQFTTGKAIEPTCGPSAAKLARGDKSAAPGYACTP